MFRFPINSIGTVIRLAIPRPSHWDIAFPTITIGTLSSICLPLLTLWEWCLHNYIAWTLDTLCSGFTSHLIFTFFITLYKNLIVFFEKLSNKPSPPPPPLKVAQLHCPTLGCFIPCFLYRALRMFTQTDGCFRPWSFIQSPSHAYTNRLSNVMFKPPRSCRYLHFWKRFLKKRKPCAHVHVCV